MSARDDVRRSGTKGMPRAEREEQLRDHAAGLFGERGYAHVSMADIAGAAGVSKPMLFAYFDSKDGLHRVCVDAVAVRLHQAIDAALAEPGDAAGAAVRTLTGIFTCLRDRPADWNVLYDRTVPSGSAAHAYAKRWRARLAKLSARGVADNLTAVSLDPLDLSAITEIWMNSVSTLVDWWIAHPGQTSEQMAARGERILTALPVLFRAA